MITRIGIVAGEIWQALEKNGKKTFSELCNEIDRSRNLILMSLGWLAREGHIVVEGEEDYLVFLRPKAASPGKVKCGQ